MHRQLWMHPALDPSESRRLRNAALRHDRAQGQTVRALAARYGLSKSQAHRLTRGVEIQPPPPRFVLRIVPAADGGFITRVELEPGPRPRAYKVRNHRRV